MHSAHPLRTNHERDLGFVVTAELSGSVFNSSQLVAESRDQHQAESPWAHLLDDMCILPFGHTISEHEQLLRFNPLILFEHLDVGINHILEIGNDLPER